MRRRSHIGGQPPEALDELASDPRIAFGLEFPSAIVANGQKNLHQLHGVSFGRRAATRPQVSAATWKVRFPNLMFSEPFRRARAYATKASSRRVRRFCF